MIYRGQCFILSLTLLLAGAGVSFGQGKLSFDPEEIDLGAIPVGADSSSTFTVTNVGDEPTLIIGLSTSCGACEAKYKGNKKLLPGAKAFVYARVKTAKIGGREFSIFLRTQPESVVEKALKLKMDIRPPVYVFPEKERLDDGPGSEPIQGSLLLRVSKQSGRLPRLGRWRQRDFIIRVHRLRREKERLSQWPDKSKKYDDYRVDYVLKRRPEEGYFTETIMLYTDHPKHKSVTYQVVKKIINDD